MSQNNRENREITIKKKNNVNKRSDGAMRPVRSPRLVDLKHRDKTPFPWSVVFSAIIMTALFLFMMMNYAEVDKYRSEIGDLNDRLSTLEKTQDDLEVTLSNKYSLADVEKYATEELGMTKNIPESNIHIITTEQADRTEMHEYDDGEEGGFGFLLTGLGEVIRDFLN